MRIARFLPFLAFLVIAFSACEKDEVIVDDNIAPPDHTIPALVVETYINKCYISLLGRKPTEAEESAAKTTLNAGGLDEASRHAMLQPVLASVEYRNKILENSSIKLLTVPFDPVDVQFRIEVTTTALNDPQYAAFVELIQMELDRYEELLSTPQDFTSGAINVRQLHRRLVNNGIYDELNMGSFNFVVSLYNHFLFRDPTESETLSATTMVDGLTSVAFFTTGDSKGDFIDIFLASDDYYEGQVRELFYRYLFREPTPEELAYHTVNYKNSNNYEALQKAMLSLDEFVGL